MERLAQENAAPPVQVAKYDTLIQEVSAKLNASSVGKMPHIQRALAQVQWVKMESQTVAADVEVSRTSKNKVSLFPSLLDKSRDVACLTIIKELGNLLFTGCSEDVARRWTNKLCLPTDIQINSIQSKLTTEFKSYREVVESFKTAMDRYVALNIANALISKGVPYSQVLNLDIKTWGATQEYANLKKYHTIIPMLSAYASKEIFENFGAAFADWVCGTNGITESSVAASTHGIIEDILNSTR
jgi:hypothetical protein